MKYEDVNDWITHSKYSEELDEINELYEKNKKLTDLCLEATGLLNISDLKSDDRSWFTKDVKNWLKNARNTLRNN